MPTLIKLTLAVLLFICLLDCMPYQYYQLVRFAVLIGFAILAYLANEQEQKTEALIYVCLAILFVAREDTIQGVRDPVTK